MKKLFLFFSILVLSFSANLFAQQQWINFNPILGANNISHPVSITFDRFNDPWILCVDSAYSVGVLYHCSQNIWTLVDTLVSTDANTNMVIDNNDIIYCATYTNTILSYDTHTGISIYFQVGIPGHFENVMVNPVNNDKWFYAYPMDEWVKLNDVDTVRYSMATIGISPIIIHRGCFDANGNFYFVYTDNSATFSEIMKFDGTNWVHLNSAIPPLPTNINYDYITIDKYSNIWLVGDKIIGSFLHSYLTKFDGSNYTVFGDSTLAALTYFTNIQADNLGNMWLLDDGGALWKFDGTVFSYFAPPYALQYSRMTLDNSNNVWYSFDWFDYQQTGITIFNESGFKTLSGKVYNDVNSNGSLDIGESGLSNENVYSNTVSNYTKTDLNGNYNIIFFDSSQVCQIDHQLKPYRTHTSSPTTYNITPSINGITGFDFGVHATPGINDMIIYTSPAIARPGFDCTYNINWNNPGTTTQTDTITFTYDPALTYLNATPAPLSVSGNILKWKFSNAQPLDNGIISVHFNVPASVTIGDTLNCLATIGNISIDNTPTDNSWSTQTIVTGSFDPNEKIAEPSQFAVAGEWLYYTIYFQNTGTDTAFTVVIHDTLDADLDIASFEMLGSSHLCYTELSGFGFLKFTFNNILLPDSNVNETMSHGYVTYRVRAAANAAIGTPISNTAFIYFDFNSPIVTNTTLNTVYNPLGVKEVLAKNDFSLIPNPASNYISINTNGVNLPYVIEITDAMGRIISIEDAKTNKQLIITSHLQNGVYFVTVKNEQSQLTRKLVLQK